MRDYIPPSMYELRKGHGFREKLSYTLSRRSKLITPHMAELRKGKPFSKRNMQLSRITTLEKEAVKRMISEFKLTLKVE